mmetsp:Transcript_27665/g.57916  ORF Transcript_27665/g.57916 Transcript_27665/m.57916 type:complete len:100 (-) Transcript_27665:15-314(-)
MICRAWQVWVKGSSAPPLAPKNTCHSGTVAHTPWLHSSIGTHASTQGYRERQQSCSYIQKKERYNASNQPDSTFMCLSKRETTTEPRGKHALVFLLRSW